MKHELTFPDPMGAGQPPDAVAQRKVDNTPAIDCRVLRLETSRSTQLCDTPFQERYSFMWDILTEYSAALSGRALE